MTTGNETKDLLNADLDNIVTAGVESAQKKKKKIAIGLCILLVLGAVGGIAFIITQNQNKLIYQEAQAAIDARNYELAIALLEKVGNYKDSREKLENIRFTSSEEYATGKETVEALLLGSGSCVAVSYEYDLTEYTVKVSGTISEIVIEADYLWPLMTEQFRKITELEAETFSNAGYNVGFEVTIYDNTNENVLHISKNGETCFDAYAET